jgi:hypothetical protein
LDAPLSFFLIFFSSNLFAPIGGPGSVVVVSGAPLTGELVCVVGAQSIDGALR